jgi:hypothetical protein
LQVELLGARELLSASVLPGFAVQVQNDTLDHALNIGDLTSMPAAVLRGSIAPSPDGGGAIEWAQFTLDTPSTVVLTTQPGTSLAAVLSLYNNDPLDTSDYYDPFGNRLLAQADAQTAGAPATLTRELAAGTYFVAVSGAGNRAFSPYLADSGYPGGTGSFAVEATATPLSLAATSGPIVLSADPAAGASLSSSPFVLRVNFSSPIDPSTIELGANAQLIFNPQGTFGTSLDQQVSLAGFNVSTAGDELQLLPSTPLANGFYHLSLGDSILGMPGADGVERPLALSGTDSGLTFQVTGAGAHDTPGTALNLGNITSTGLVQVAGAIGVDPTDPVAFDPAQVEMYQFNISGAGTYAFTAEAFAQRIGSPLDVALSLFRLGADHQLHLVTADDNTFNDTEGTNGSLPLFSDAVMYAGLTAGNYFVAVSSSGNVPDPLDGILPAAHGIFNPNVSHSGLNGSSTGPYVLNLGVQPDNTPPAVTAASFGTGVPLTAPPTQLVVQFSKSVDLQMLAFQAYQENNVLQPVYIQGAAGIRYYPRFESWNPATDQATFLMLDALPNGAYQLHLSGALGLTDLAGLPLVGNSASGDYVQSFVVAGPTRGTAGAPTHWLAGANHTLAQPQILGVLFPNELQAGTGIDITRSTATHRAGTADYFEFQVLQGRPYFFDLTGSGLPHSGALALFDTTGHAIAGALSDNGQILQALLQPGIYIIRIADSGMAESYRLHLTLGGAEENPTPLTIGPTPVLQLRLSDVLPRTLAPTPASVASVSASTSLVALLPTRGPDVSPTTAAGVSPAAFIDVSAIRIPTAVNAVPTIDRAAVSATAVRLTESAPASVVFNLSSAPVGGVAGVLAPPSAPLLFNASSSLAPSALVANAGPAFVGVSDVAPQVVPVVTPLVQAAHEPAPHVVWAAADLIVPRLTPELESLAAGRPDLLVEAAPALAARQALEAPAADSFAPRRLYPWVVMLVTLLTGAALRRFGPRPQWSAALPLGWCVKPQESI